MNMGIGNILPSNSFDFKPTNFNADKSPEDVDHPILWELSEDELEEAPTEAKFNEIQKSNKEKFAKLKEEHAHLFNCQEIIEKNPEDKDDMTQVASGKFAVEYIKDCKGLWIEGVKTGLVVMARATSNNDEACIALCYTSDHEEVLKEIIEELKKKGCEKDTIKIYIVGGQLPYRDKDKIANSIDDETKCLELSENYPIKGVAFNNAEGVDDSLDVFITENEIIWRHQDQPESTSEEEFKNSKENSNFFDNLLKSHIQNYV